MIYLVFTLTKIYGFHFAFTCLTKKIKCANCSHPYCPNSTIVALIIMFIESHVCGKW